MKKYSVLFIALFLLISCSKDGDSGISGIPSGEIVPFAQRDLVLTGNDSSTEAKSTTTGKKAAIVEKWWKHDTSKVDFSGCGDEAEDEELSEQGYYMFFPDGNVYVKSSAGGTSYNAGDWEWDNPSKKNKIRVSWAGDIAFTITSLNNSELIFGTKQSQGGCSVVTWERFTND